MLSLARTTPPRPASSSVYDPRTPDRPPEPDRKERLAEDMHDRFLHAQHLIENEGLSVEEAAEEAMLREEILRDAYEDHPGLDADSE